MVEGERDIPNTFKNKNKIKKLKIGRGHDRHFFQRRNTDGQHVHEKILSLTNHQENENQSHMRLSLHAPSPMKNLINIAA